MAEMATRGARQDTLCRPQHSRASPASPPSQFCIEPRKDQLRSDDGKTWTAEEREEAMGDGNWSMVTKRVTVGNGNIQERPN